MALSVSDALKCVRYGIESINQKFLIYEAIYISGSNGKLLIANGNWSPIPDRLTGRDSRPNNIACKLTGFRRTHRPAFRDLFDGCHRGVHLPLFLLASTRRVVADQK